MQKVTASYLEDFVPLTPHEFAVLQVSLLGGVSMGSTIA